ncbi:hypothetical protein L3Y34_007661 [Caenorhabditis briggsae]|uniref:Uncharacterized protein n=1 Tax=Caenorhabditis briggsae TaxID=6238 RepID=A0AAE9D0F0_CAEBR|nr:hypothetical protein L3Y34_007661 [Caenorhabditis briggsae]
MKTEKALGVTQSKRELPRTGARKKEKDNDGEKPNRKTPEKDQQILKRKIENRAQRKTGQDAARLFQTTDHFSTSKSSSIS